MSIGEAGTVVAPDNIPAVKQLVLIPKVVSLAGKEQNEKHRGFGTA